MSDTTSATCAYPECDRPVAPPPATGGRSRYCDDPEHTATTAFRARRARGGEPGTGERSASLAGATLRENVERLGQVLAEFRALSQQAAEHLQVATNPEVIQAEMAAVRAEALQAVATAQGELADERQARLTADEAAEAAQADAETARADASSARAELREGIIKHEEARQAIRQEADQAIEQARREAAGQVSAATADRDAAVAAAEADKTAAIAAAGERADRAAAEAREAIDRARAEAEALVRSAETDRDQAREQTAQHQEAARAAGQRAAAAEARADATRADADRAHEEAARMLDQVRADATRERDELREAMQARVQAAEAELERREREHAAELGRIEAAAEARAAVLEESRTDLRARAERAEHDLDQARAVAASREEVEGTTTPARRAKRRNPGE